jgi:hypothetical protein
VTESPSVPEKWAMPDSGPIFRGSALLVWRGAVTQTDAERAHEDAYNRPSHPKIGSNRTIAGGVLLLSPPEEGKRDDKEGEGQSFEPRVQGHGC